MSALPAPARWLEVTVDQPDDPEMAAFMVEALLELPAGGVQETPSGLRVHLPDSLEGLSADPGAWAEALARKLGALMGSADPWPVATRWQEHRDWAECWRQGLGPRRIPPRLVIAPSWAPGELTDAEIRITIDPGMAFGTAEHATTRGCLRLVQTVVASGDLVADVGSGSGILAIAAACLGARRVLAYESDEWSCEALRENLEANGVLARVDIHPGEVSGPELVEAGPFHGILANMQAFILLPLLSAFRESLVPGGWLIVSGILRTEESSMREALGRHGFDVTAEDGEGEWWTGLARYRNEAI
ncbi:MAG: hypothetical protein EA422_11960 [Gemmatimonadales bacterium]|nr:MAG: hypothetical protein EA422_11960 [Gemmatimonadales bacterium]